MMNEALSSQPDLTCRLEGVGDRKDRSFELAYLGLMQADEWELFHGTICKTDGVPTAYAWLVLDDWVYDAVADLALPASEFKGMYCAVGLARFPKHGAKRFYRWHEHYGPWCSTIASSA